MSRVVPLPFPTAQPADSTEPESPEHLELFVRRIQNPSDLRITYQLIDVKTDKILGRDMIDLKYDKRIKPGEPVNSLAHEYYLRGVDLVSSHDFPLAIKMLEKSAEIDPTYALTWAYLG